jgi:steroid delta-isomerase-like uncharacterized protein
MNSDDTGVVSKTSETPATTTRDEVAALFVRRQEAYDDLDATALAADYAEDAVVESPTAGAHTGRSAVEATFRAVFNAFLDMAVTSDDLIIDGDRVAQAMTVTGTHVGEFLGLAPTGKRFRLRAVFLYELRNGKIVRERRIYDFTGMLMQIGVLKAKPI